MNRMNRRSFLRAAALGITCTYKPPHPLTKHLIFIVNGAARKKDYYENEAIAQNIRRIATEGFVFEEDHCEQISSHDAAFAELLGVNVNYRLVPSLRVVPQVMEQCKPRLLVWRDVAHDVGHDDYEAYLRVVRRTDAAVGEVFDWVRRHPYFSANTAIVIRPEFGRDDEVNRHGQLHHSRGFYYTHRVASIFWGPDFKRGVDRTTAAGRRDLLPSAAIRRG